MMEFAVLLVILGALALIAGPRLMARRGPGGGMARGPGGGMAPGPGGENAGGPGGGMARRSRGEMARGTLLVTGVSPRPEVPGEQFVTITGVITGPTVGEHVVYQRMAVDTASWPTMGQLLPVVYSPKNPDKWFFAPPEQPA